MGDALQKWLEVLVRRLAELPRERKRTIMVLADVAIIPIALWTAIALKLGTFQHGIADDASLYIASILASIPVFSWMGLYRAVVRYIGPRVLVVVVTGVTVSVAITTGVNALLTEGAQSLSVFAIYWALALIYVGGSRFLYRSFLYSRRADVPRVVIYGAGSAGAQLAGGLIASGQFMPVAFIDDNPSLQRSLVNGIEVLAPEALPDLMRDDGVSMVLLALPSQSRRRRQGILKRLEPLGIYVKTVPDYSDIISGAAAVQDVRDVDVNDLLGRDAVPPNEKLLDACIFGKSVMVTGAGGSIGAELCRQIVRLGPTRLLLFEASELALYNIDREIRALIAKFGSAIEVVSLLGSAHHKYRVREVIQAYGVNTIYHAAAYKHVPIVEQNVIEGIHNNVFSTWYAAEAALECLVETFVLISTDKAVNPANVMGATKRFAEIVLQGLHERGSATRFCMVRFGNVLESSGSVVPLFRDQIKRGGPVTVTHKEVIRYFMTIPEAAQLVLQAGAMARGGDVFVLDMGKPVRIEDLARRMIGLMGLTVQDEAHPDGDIEIVYTGLRPAEKLYEELLIGNNVTGTEHPMILRAMEHSLPWNTVMQALEQMLIALNKFDCQQARDLLMNSVAEYRPAGDIQDLVWARKAGLMAPEASNVTTLQKRRSRQGPPGWQGPGAAH